MPGFPLPPRPQAQTVPFQRDWTLDLGATAAPAWTLAHIQSEENQKAIANNALAAYAGGRGTDGEAGILDRIFGREVRLAAGNRFGASARDVTSQFGEDGIIEALLAPLQCRNRTFLDLACFGAKTGSRVWQLATTHGWTGHVVRVPSPAGAWECLDEFPAGSMSYIDLASIDFEGRLEFLRLIRRAVKGDIDFLSIGVDGADYQTWQSLQEFRPVLVAVGFNPTIPNDIYFVQAPRLDVNHGCSLYALVELARELGYQLAACSAATAFFVRRDYFHRLGLRNNDIESMHVPMLMHLFQLFDGTLRLAGLRRLLWHGLELAEDEIQTLPRALRRWPTSVPPGPHADLYVDVN